MLRIISLLFWSVLTRMMANQCALSLLAAAVLAQAASAAFVHPGIIVSKPMLDQIRADVKVFRLFSVQVCGAAAGPHQGSVAASANAAASSSSVCSLCNSPIVWDYCCCCPHHM